MSANERVNFGSKIGIILASAGSAVGLGNIWRFPCEVGENGGAAFILVYILCVMFLGIPVMVSEFLIGRRSRANTGGALEMGRYDGGRGSFSYLGILWRSGRMDIGVYGGIGYGATFREQGLYAFLQ